jgi:hypothetical protein
VLAADHAKAKAELTDQHKALRQTLIKERPSLFPDFETWVSKKHGKEAAERYRYAEQVAEIIGQDTKHKQQREHDIRSYVPEAIGQEVHYRNSMGMTDFVDHGPKISFLTRSNESVLAGLQLAQQRFGKSLTLAGGDDFKQQAIEIAVRSGITIANQELQDAIKEERERQALERKIAMQSETQQQFWRYHEAVGADSYRVSSRSESTGKTWAMGRQQDGSIPGYAPDSLPWQSIEQLKQKQSEHLYLTPLSRTHHLILVDDTTPDKIEQMERDGIQLAYLQQSSTASFQAIIKIPRLEPVDRPDLASKEKSPEYLASVQLAQTLNQKYGDPHLSNAVQPHRMPATPNVKKKHRASDGMFPTVTLISAPGHTWDLGTSHIKAIIERQVQLEQNTKTVHSLTRQPDTTAPRPPADHSLYDDFKRDIEKKILKGPAQDLSTLDYMVALRLRAVGKSQHEVASIIESCTDQAGRRHQWQDYAGRTADRAFGFTGTRDLERMSKYHPSWQKIADKAQAQQAQDRVPSHRGRGAGMQM